MLTKVFGLTCPSLCSSQQSGDSSAPCSPFLLLLPQKSPGPDPQISKSWIQPGVHPLPVTPGQDQMPELSDSQAGAGGHRGSAQWPLILQGGQGCSSLGLGLLLPWASEPLDMESCSERPCCARPGDSAVTHTVPGSIGSTGWV